MPTRRNVSKPPARVIRRGSRLLKGAPAAAPGPAGSPPGGLVVNRWPSRPFYGGIEAFSNIPAAAGVAGKQPPLIAVYRRTRAQYSRAHAGAASVPGAGAAGPQPAAAAVAVAAPEQAPQIGRRYPPRAVFRGLPVKAGIPYLLPRPPPTAVTRRAAARAVWRPTSTRTTNAVPAGTAPDHLTVARRYPARAVVAFRPVRTVNAPSPVSRTGGFTARRSSARGKWQAFLGPPNPPAPGPAGTVPPKLILRPRTYSRAVWRPTGTRTTNLPYGSQPGRGSVTRRAVTRAVWRPTSTRTTNPVSGQVQPRPVVARRGAARAVWYPTRTTTVNAIPGGGITPDHLIISRRQTARAVWLGWVSRTVNAAPGGPVAGTAPDHLVVARRSTARAVWYPARTRTTNLVPGASPPHLVVARRTSSRAYWRPTVTKTVNLPYGSPPGAGLVRRRSPARAVWYPTRTATSNAVAPQAGVGMVQPRATVPVPRRGPHSGQWAGWVSRTVNAPPAVFGVPPAHLIVARRTAVRGLWRGTTVRTTNRPAAPPTMPHLTIARRGTARAVWDSITGPPRTAKPGTGGLIRRRSSNRAVSYWRPVRTVNAPVPQGTVPKHLIIGRRSAARAVVEFKAVHTIQPQFGPPVLLWAAVSGEPHSVWAVGESHGRWVAPGAPHGRWAAGEPHGRWDVSGEPAGRWAVSEPAGALPSQRHPQ